MGQYTDDVNFLRRFQEVQFSFVRSYCNTKTAVFLWFNLDVYLTRPSSGANVSQRV